MLKPTSERKILIFLKRKIKKHEIMASKIRISRSMLGETMLGPPRLGYAISYSKFTLSYFGFRSSTYIRCFMEISLIPLWKYFRRVSGRHVTKWHPWYTGGEDCVHWCVTVRHVAFTRISFSCDIFHFGLYNNSYRERQFVWKLSSLKVVAFQFRAFVLRGLCHWASHVTDFGIRSFQTFSSRGGSFGIRNF